MGGVLPFTSSCPQFRQPNFPSAPQRLATNTTDPSLIANTAGVEPPFGVAERFTTLAVGSPICTVAVPANGAVKVAKSVVAA